MELKSLPSVSNDYIINFRKLGVKRVNIKNYQNLFETTKKRSKKLHYSKVIIKYKEHIKRTWSVIKEAMGKEKN